MNLVECLAKGPLTDGQRKAKRRDVKWLVDIGEGQLLGFFDKLATRPVVSRECFFRFACD